ncbi:MAG: hypothetical protein HQ478_13240 [Chloroflexi bacterium]|nr:hypothetical protein [Chloroflexota bacterium]
MRLLTLIVVAAAIVSVIAVVSTRTTSAASSTVSGTVQLQGVTAPIPSSIAITLILTLSSDGSTTTAVADPSGGFSFSGVADGAYKLSGQAPGFMLREAAEFEVSHAAYVMPPAQLHFGLVNSDGVVSVLDVSAVASSFGQTVSGRVDGQGRVVDFNADGIVDILDVSATAGNFGTVSPLPWSGTISVTPLATPTPAPTATPSPAPPSAPQNVRAELGPGFATVTWDAPVSTGGSPITGYTVVPFRYGTRYPNDSKSVTVSGTERQAYLLCCDTFPSSYTVVAENALGAGPESPTSEEINFGPGAYGMYRPIVTGGNSTANVKSGPSSWSIPSVHTVLVKSRPGGFKQASTSTLIAVSEGIDVAVTNDTPLQFLVIGVTDVNATISIWSDPIIPIDPTTIPPPPNLVEFPYQGTHPDPAGFDTNAFVIRGCGSGPLDLWSLIYGMRLGGCNLHSRFLLQGGEFEISSRVDDPGDAFIGWSGIGFRLNDESGNVDVEVADQVFPTNVEVPSLEFVEYRMEWAQDLLRAYVDEVLVLELSENIPWELKRLVIGEHRREDGLFGGTFNLGRYYVNDVSGIATASIEASNIDDAEVVATEAISIVIEDSPPFAAKWGSNGVIPGTFRDITAMAFGSDSRLYMSSKISNYQSFEPDGTFKERMWDIGMGMGEFLSIDGIAFAPNGNMYLVDTLAATITVMSPSGDVIDRWDSSDVTSPGMVSPSDIAISQNGDVYVIGNELGLIHHFNLAGDYLGNWKHVSRPATIGMSGSGRSNLAVDSTGAVYAPTTGGLGKYSSNGELLEVWSRAEMGGLNSIVDIAIDSLDNIYIADAYPPDPERRKITKISPSGVPLAIWGSDGDRDGELDGILTLAIDSQDRVFAFDPELGRITVFGDPLPGIPLPTATPIPQPTPISGALPQLQDTFADRPELVVVSLRSAINR